MYFNHNSLALLCCRRFPFYFINNIIRFFLSFSASNLYDFLISFNYSMQIYLNKSIDIGGI